MNFYIISVDNAGTETVVYQGKYDNFANREDVITELDETRSADISKKLEKLRKQQAELEKREKDINKKLVEQEKLISLLDLRTSIDDSKQIKILDGEETKTRKKLQQENELVSKQKKNLEENRQEHGQNDYECTIDQVLWMSKMIIKMVTSWTAVSSDPMISHPIRIPILGIISKCCVIPTLVESRNLNLVQ